MLSIQSAVSVSVNRVQQEKVESHHSQPLVLTGVPIEIVKYLFGMTTPSDGMAAGTVHLPFGSHIDGGKSLVRRASEGVLLSSPLVIKQLQDLSWPSPNEGG